MIQIIPPNERECQRCGRRESWDDDRGVWSAEATDDDPDRGDPHCLHEWDINGTYSPVEER